MISGLAASLEGGGTVEGTLGNDVAIQEIAASWGKLSGPMRESVLRFVRSAVSACEVARASEREGRWKS